MTSARRSFTTAGAAPPATTPVTGAGGASLNCSSAPTQSGCSSTSGPPPWSSVRRPSKRAWSRCARMACAAFSTVIQPSKKSSNTPDFMPKYNYVAMDARGKETKGTLEVGSQNEAIGRIRDMGFFPTKVVEDKGGGGKAADTGANKPGKKGDKKSGGALNFQINIPGLSGRVKSKVLTTFTRQLSTLVQAGLPLLRGLRVLQKQEKSANLKTILGDLGTAIEGGSTFSEALAQHPKVFNRLFVNMVKAGEIGGVLEVVLRRLSEFMEKAQKIKGKVIAAMFYPCAVITVATGIMAVLMILVIPKFKEVFAGTLTGGKKLPDFTQFVLDISDAIRLHIVDRKSTRL